jgi:DNA invertase Pin-like site-specific DNA recombinase
MERRFAVFSLVSQPVICHFDGRLTLNVLLSFAQFERELTGEMIRDKIAASKREGIWMGWRDGSAGL